MFFLKQLERSVADNVVVRFFFFLVCTLITIGFMGYHFGTFDQASHIPFLRQMVDPTLYPADALLPLRFTKYSYFWQIFIPIFRMGFLEVSMFILYVFSTFLTFMAIWRLTYILFSSARIATLATFLMTVPHFGFGYFNVFEFSLVNRVVVFPFLLICIGSYLKKQHIWALFVMGILFNFHSLSVIFILIMIGVDMMVRWKEIGIQKILHSGMGFLIAASPVLIWKFQTSGVSFSADYLWIHDISQGVLMHIYNVSSVWPPFLFASLNGIIQIVLMYIYSRTFGNGLVHRIMRNFLLAIVITIIVHVITTILYPSVFVMQFQLLRISIPLILFFNLYATAHIVRSSKSGLFVLLLTSMTTYLYALGVYLYRRKRFFRWGKWIVGLQCVAWVVMTIYLLQLGMYMPGIYIYGRKTPSVDVQLWVKHNTPKDAMIFAPLYLWSLYDADWRVFSQRSTIVTWSELLEIAFIPDKYPDWVSRFDAVVPGVRQQFHGHFTENQERIRKAYLSLSPDDVSRIVRSYHASYFVTEKHPAYPFPLLYENSVFRVYDMRSEKMAY